jgi:hypothetical protein
MTRPSRGAKLEVQLSRSESVEWADDPQARTELVKGFSKMAAARGRKFVQVKDALGTELALVAL